jgi:hypothetical protein
VGTSPSLTFTLLNARGNYVDKQAVFTTVANHLLKQGKRSVTEEAFIASCVYRGDDGLKCAIGVLIPDELYTPSMEGKQATVLIQTNPKLYAHLEIKNFFDDTNFLMELQQLHDEKDPVTWVYELKLLADRHKLVFPAQWAEEVQ